MSNRVVCVTGASRGIGRHIALLLAREDYKIIVASNEVENNDKVVEEIKSVGGDAVAQFLDLMQPEQITEAFKQMASVSDNVDVSLEKPT